MTVPAIGPWRLDAPLVLAPMAGVTDAPFRALCLAQGAALAVGEMTTADTSRWHTPKSRARLANDGAAGPHVIQIAGSEPAELAEAARRAVDLGADVIDINMGCPAKKVCRRLAGSALLRDESLVARILEAVVAAVPVPVTLKTRTGWAPEGRNGVTVARIAEAAGIRAIAVHGRTRACAFRGEAEYATIAAIKRAVRIPVFANGDIDSPAKALAVLARTGADGVMIGRAACGRPWLFAELRAALAGEPPPDEPAPALRRDMITDHLDRLYSLYGEERGVRVARKHLCWYAEHLDDGSRYRAGAVRAESASEQVRITREFFARQEQRGASVRRAEPPQVAATWQADPADPSRPTPLPTASPARASVRSVISPRRPCVVTSGT